MTSTPGNASRNLPGKPPVIDLAIWQVARFIPRSVANLVLAL